MLLKHSPLFYSLELGIGQKQTLFFFSRDKPPVILDEIQYGSELLVLLK
jgi:hypothetical protein